MHPLPSTGFFFLKWHRAYGCLQVCEPCDFRFLVGGLLGQNPPLWLMYITRVLFLVAEIEIFGLSASEPLLPAAVNHKCLLPSTEISLKKLLSK